MERAQPEDPAARRVYGRLHGGGIIRRVLRAVRGAPCAEPFRHDLGGIEVARDPAEEDLFGGRGDPAADCDGDLRVYR
jgi:hypothetical protein